MMTSTNRARHVLVLAMVLTIAACGGADDETDMAEQEMDATSQDVPPGMAMPVDAGAPLTAADLDAYERGMQKEKEMVEDLVKQAEGTTSDEDQMKLMTAAMEDQTMDDGAQAAGLSLERYRELRNRMTEALNASSLSIMGSAMREQAAAAEAQIEALAAQGLTAEQVEQSRKNAQQMREQLDAQEKAGLEMIAPDARESFKQRALRLDSLRMVTVGLRVKVAS